VRDERDFILFWMDSKELKEFLQKKKIGWMDGWGIEKKRFRTEG
jgi:hypothetical protein